MIPILFQTDDVLAVDKPEGLPSIPGSGAEVCLLSLLSASFPEKLYVVHRLDKEVSGVMLFARNAAAHKLLNDQFSGRQVRKTYAALAHGIFAVDEGAIDRPLRQFGSGRMGVDVKRGKPSQTFFRVIERLKKFTLVEARPITGRRHQIRVHFYSLGHPLVGDLRYGDRLIQLPFPRLMLHAQHIEFRLPSGQEVTVESPIPASFRQVLEKKSHA